MEEVSIKILYINYPWFKECLYGLAKIIHLSKNSKRFLLVRANKMQMFIYGIGFWSRILG
jgi:hypothetical protein